MWVGSVEWRVPIVKRVEIDAVDHFVGLRNVYLATFYDVGNTYVNGKEVGPVAHALGAGLRLDVSWLRELRRSTLTLRLDVAKSVNTNTGVQVWVGINHPF